MPNLLVHGRLYGEDHVPLNLLLSLLVETSTAFLYPDGFYRKALDGLLVTQCLGMSEQQLPPRQVWGRKFIIHGVRNPQCRPHWLETAGRRSRRETRRLCHTALEQQYLGFFQLSRRSIYRKTQRFQSKHA